MDATYLTGDVAQPTHVHGDALQRLCASLLVSLVGDGARGLKLGDVATEDPEQQPTVALTRLFEEAD
jgi:hypothetical protein